MNASDLSLKKAVLVSLNVRLWNANKKDDAVSAEVATLKDLKDPSVARFWKSLMPDNDRLKRVNSLDAKARKIHYANTFRWAHNGPRILPTANFEAYMAEMNAVKVEWEPAVLAFLEEYEQAKLNAKHSLNTIWVDTDYPSQEVLAEKFGIDVLVLPMPLGVHFDADLPEDATDTLRKGVDTNMADSFRRANEDLWRRTYEVLTSVAETMADPVGAREATLAALRKQLALLDRLNFTGDARLEKLRKSCEDRINAMSLSDWKRADGDKAAALKADLDAAGVTIPNPELKADERKAKVAQIADSMRLFMGGGSNAA